LTIMDYKYINQLLERYWKCETTLEEEGILRTFFSQDAKDIPADLQRYQSLFQLESHKEGLDESFDEKMLSMIEGDSKRVKARTISLSERFMPVFKAAAVVAIILTLGNAMQVPFRHQEAGTATEMEKTSQGASVAYSDSLILDSTQQSSIDPATAPAPALIK